MKTILSSLAACMIAGAMFGATPLAFKFKVLDTYGNSLKHVTINTYNGNELIDSQKSRFGRTKLVLESGHVYTVEIKLNGFVTKRIAISANVSEEQIWDNVYKFYVELEPKSHYNGITDADDYTDYPTVLIELDEEEGKFDFNRTYAISSRIHRNAVLKPAEPSASLK